MKFNFQKIVIVIAIILLILALAFIGAAISNEKNTHDFPPVIAECPDYWSHDVEQNKCVNDHELGDDIPGYGKLKEFLINDPRITTGPGAGMCNKKNAMNDFKLSWDGITNNPKLDTC